MAAKQDTKSLVVISLDLTSKSFPVLFRVDNLPYNSFKVVPVPGPTGGLLVLSPNGLIHIDQTSIPGISCSVNKFFGKEKDIKIADANDELALNPTPYYGTSVTSDYSEMGIVLADCQVVFMNPDTAVILLSDGSFVEMQLNSYDLNEGFSRIKGGVKNFTLTILPGLRSSSPSAVVRVGLGFLPRSAPKGPRALGYLKSALVENQDFTQMGYFFIGSKHNNAHLVQFVEEKSSRLLEQQPVDGNNIKCN